MCAATGYYCVCVCVFAFVCVYLCMFVYACVCVYIYMCVCVSETQHSMRYLEYVKKEVIVPKDSE